MDSQKCQRLAQVLAVGFRQGDRTRSNPYTIEEHGSPDNHLITGPSSANPGSDAHMALCFHSKRGILSKLCWLDLFIENVRPPSL